MSRVEMIRRMLAKNTDDVFLLYSLGMELASTGEFAPAVEQFRRCVELDGDYLPAYTEAGKAFRLAGKLDEARAMFQAGLQLAARQGKAHDCDYLRQQLDSLPKS